MGHQPSPDGRETLSFLEQLAQHAHQVTGIAQALGWRFAMGCELIDDLGQQPVNTSRLFPTQCRLFH